MRIRGLAAVTAAALMLAVTGCGGSACSGGLSWYSCWSRRAHRPAWRRDTRLETAVAVPATRAVRTRPRKQTWHRAVPFSVRNSLGA